MKRILSILVAAVFAAASFAQSAPSGTYPVKGEVQIRYNTRTQLDGSKPKEGATDVYTLNINVANSALFKGSIIYLPFIKNTISSNQVGKVTFDMDLDVVNPNNPAQTRNVGKLFGSAPIDETNVYRFSDGGGVKVAVFPIGAAKGFESRFNGLALAKPPAASGFKKITQEAVRLVSSKGGAIVLTKYDKMEFQSHVLPAGPVQIYPETTVTGTLFYDYGRSAWHFNNVTFTYAFNGQRMMDILTGSIRWVEDVNRKSNGQGRYEFDIRVNEPPPNESAMFAGVADEAAFFASDNSIPSLTGAMRYKDTISQGTVVSSNVEVDLTANNLTKQQVMNLSKLLFLTSVVPLNAE